MWLARDHHDRRAGTLVLSEGAVEKHIASIFGKLSLEPEAADNRRVLAVLRYLRA